MIEETNPQAEQMGAGVPQQGEPQAQSFPQDEAKTDSIESGMVNKDEVKLGPAQEAQLDAYTDNATIVVYSEKTQPTVLQLLQSKQSPVESVSNAAFTLHRQLESQINKTGERMTEITLCLGAAHLVSELIGLAEIAKLYTLNNDERLEAFRGAIKRYFEEGIAIFTQKGASAEGAIDPVKLQQTMEPLLTKEQKQMGDGWAKQHGISQTAPASGMMAMETKLQQMPQQAPQQQGIMGSVQ